MGVFMAAVHVPQNCFVQLPFVIQVNETRQFDNLPVNENH